MAPDTWHLKLDTSASIPRKPRVNGYRQLSQQMVDHGGRQSDAVHGRSRWNHRQRDAADTGGRVQRRLRHGAVGGAGLVFVSSGSSELTIFCALGV